MRNILKLENNERDKIFNLISSLNSNPYSSFQEFYEEVKNIEHIPHRFKEFCFYIKNSNFYEKPYFIIKNSPIDTYIPFLNYNNPVADKKLKKKTFISEGYLALISHLINKPPVAYSTLNDGDIFQDIHPMRIKSHDQSQKSIGNIYFHRDFMNRRVSPDYLLLLGLRHIEDIKVFTNIASAIDIINCLPDEVIEKLKEKEYITPAGDPLIKKKAGDNKLKKHSIIYEKNGVFEIALSEKNTYTTKEYSKYLSYLINCIHKNKKGIEVKSGDFLVMTNIYAHHNREIVGKDEENKLKNRWIMKTANIDCLSSIKEQTIKYSNNIING